MLGGAQVLEGCPVTRILVDDGKVQLEEGAWTMKKMDGWIDCNIEGQPKTIGQKLSLPHMKVVGVETPEGKVATSRVVLAAGAWSKQLG